jgi:UDP-perosamine 4-acetyltransferase
MNRSVLLIGGGGHARVVLDGLLAMGRFCLGVTAREAPDLADLSYIGDDEAAFHRFPKGVEAALGVGGTPRQGASGTALRRRVYDQYVERGFHFPPVIGRGVIMAPDVVLEDGAQIIAGAILQPNVRVAANAIVNTGARVDHDTVVGRHAMVAPGAVLCGGVEIGVGAYVGAGATVLQGIRIGADAVVAAGAVATADVPDGGYVSRR